jgi:hypothetical protein
MVAHDTPCLGPVTQAGCGEICPAYDRGCYGCFGPARQVNLSSLASHLLSSGLQPTAAVHLLRNFNGYAPEFRAASQQIEAQVPSASASPGDQQRGGG